VVHAWRGPGGNCRGRAVRQVGGGAWCVLWVGGVGGLDCRRRAVRQMGVTSSAEQGLPEACKVGCFNAEGELACMPGVWHER
jgi:hypothetical protein